jgi:hypothetical protein
MTTGERAIDTAVVQTPYPPADLNARGVQRRAAARLRVSEAGDCKMWLLEALAVLLVIGGLIALLCWLFDHPWPFWGITTTVFVLPQIIFGAPETGSALWWIDGALGFWGLWLLGDGVGQKRQAREWRKQREQREYEASLLRPKRYTDAELKATIERTIQRHREKGDTSIT